MLQAKVNNPVNVIVVPVAGSIGVIRMEDGEFRLYTGDQLCATCLSARALNRWGMTKCTEVESRYDLALGDDT